MRIELPCENRALVLEPEGFHSEVLASLIIPYGSVLTICESLEELLEKAKECWHPFVFIAASKVGEAHGIEVLAELRHMPAYNESAVIMMGADPSADVILTALDRGVDLFLPKPFGDDELRVAMATASRILRERLKRSKAEARLKDREKNYSEMLGILPDIVYQIDLDGRFIYVNEAVSQLGYRPDELLGQRYSILFEETEYTRICRDYVLEKISAQGFFPDTPPKLFDERRTGDRRTEHLEVRLRHKDGDLLDKAVSSFGDVCSQGYFDQDVHRQDAQVMGTIGIIHDVTKYKVLEGRLEDALAELKENSMKMREIEESYTNDREVLEKQARVLESFSYRVAHDLKSPLMFLRSLLDLYKNKELEHLEFVSRLEKSLTHTADMVNGLYNLGKMHQRDHAWGELNLQDVVREVSSWLALEIESKNVEIVTRDLGEVKVILDIFPLILLNLMANAIKYNPSPQPKILICSEPSSEDESKVLVSVEDNGRGIPESAKAFIFEAFSRGSDEKIKEGLGVGLNTVRNAIALHESKIWVEDSPELGGARFVFELTKV